MAPYIMSRAQTTSLRWALFSLSLKSQISQELYDEIFGFLLFADLLNLFQQLLNESSVFYAVKEFLPLIEAQLCGNPEIISMMVNSASFHVLPSSSGAIVSASISIALPNNGQKRIVGVAQAWMEFFEEIGAETAALPNTCRGCLGLNASRTYDSIHRRFLDSIPLLCPKCRPRFFEERMMSNLDLIPYGIDLNRLDSRRFGGEKWLQATSDYPRRIKNEDAIFLLELSSNITPSPPQLATAKTISGFHQTRRFRNWRFSFISAAVKEVRKQYVQHYTCLNLTAEGFPNSLLPRLRGSIRINVHSPNFSKTAFLWLADDFDSRVVAAGPGGKDPYQWLREAVTGVWQHIDAIVPDYRKVTIRLGRGEFRTLGRRRTSSP